MNSDPAAARALAAALSSEELEALAQLLSRSYRRRRRLAERNAAIIGFALSIWAGESGRALARRVESQLCQYGASGWRIEQDGPPPANLARALAHRTLRLNGGTAPSKYIIERALKGIRLPQKQPR